MDIHHFNTLDKEELHLQLLRCCGSSAWVNKMEKAIPADDLVDLMEDAEECWYACSAEDWLEAFRQHPEIGDINSLEEKFAGTSAWAEGEQAEVSRATRAVMEKLDEANDHYKEKFGFIFIVCATGKSAEEILDMMAHRLHNNYDEELKIAADEQLKITQLRLEKLLS